MENMSGERKQDWIAEWQTNNQSYIFSLQTIFL